MQKDNRFFDDLAKLGTAAAGSVLEMKREIEQAVSAQVEKCASKMNYATSEEVETMRQMQVKIREEQENLSKRLEKLEKRFEERFSQ